MLRLSMQAHWWYVGLAKCAQLAWIHPSDNVESDNVESVRTCTMCGVLP